MTAHACRTLTSYPVNVRRICAKLTAAGTTLRAAVVVVPATSLMTTQPLTAQVTASRLHPHHRGDCSGVVAGGRVGGQGPPKFSSLNFSMSKIFFLSQNCSSKNSKFVAGNHPFWERLSRPKLQFRAPIIGHLQLPPPQLFNPRRRWATENARVENGFCLVSHSEVFYPCIMVPWCPLPGFSILAFSALQL